MKKLLLTSLGAIILAAACISNCDNEDTKKVGNCNMILMPDDPEMQNKMQNYQECKEYLQQQQKHIDWNNCLNKHRDTKWPLYQSGQQSIPNDWPYILKSSDPSLKTDCGEEPSEQLLETYHEQCAQKTPEMQNYQECKEYLQQHKKYTYWNNCLHKHRDAKWPLYQSGHQSIPGGWVNILKSDSNFKTDCGEEPPAQLLTLAYEPCRKSFCIAKCKNEPVHKTFKEYAFDSSLFIYPPKCTCVCKK